MTKLKAFIKTVLPICVLDYFRYGIFDGYASKSYSQEGEDMILRRIFGQKTDGFYVDVGAHHPMRFSNTYLLYKLGWTGINIEPNPEAMPFFSKIRSRDTNLNLGVASIEGTLKYYMFNDSALNTFNIEVANKRIDKSDYKIINEVSVKVSRLDKILAQHSLKFRQIDLLTIDVEGLDLDVLKSNDWEKYRPNWVLVEQLGLSDLELFDFETHAFMISKGYVLFAKTFNTLFYKLRNG